MVLSTVRNAYMILGIFSLSQAKLQSYNLQRLQKPINRIHCGFIYICLMVYSVSVINFFVSKATTFAQYAEGSVFCIIILTRSLFYYSLNSKQRKISALIHDLEAVIRSSKVVVHFHHSVWNNCCEIFDRKWAIARNSIHLSFDKHWNGTIHEDNFEIFGYFDIL